MTGVVEANLLAEGMRSYPKALAALNEFGRLVTSTIRVTLAEELSKLSAAMRVEAKEDELGDYVRPNRLAIANPKEAILGARIDRRDKSGWSLYSYVWWSEGETKLSISIYLADGTVAESIFTSFNKFPTGIRSELIGREVYITRTLAPDKADQLPVILRDLIHEFADLWAKVGGLSRFLEPDAGASG